MEFIDIAPQNYRDTPLSICCNISQIMIKWVTICFHFARVWCGICAPYWCMWSFGFYVQSHSVHHIQSEQVVYWQTFLSRIYQKKLASLANSLRMHYKNKKYFQEPFLVFQLVTDKALLSVSWRRKSISKNLFWCFSLSLTGHFCQYLEEQKVLSRTIFWCFSLSITRHFCQ